VMLVKRGREEARMSGKERQVQRQCASERAGEKDGEY